MRRSLLSVRRLDTAIKPSSPLNPIRFFSMSPCRLSDEDAKFDEEVKATEKWFSSPRFAEIKRPYTAASVVEKRGTLPVIYPCDYQARKLWDLLGKYAAEKKPLLTMGAIDPVQMTQMAPYQEVLYVSGWACSSVLASVNEVGPDLGDYAYTTVPNQVHRMFKAQQLHDKKQYHARRHMSAEERAKTPYVDYMRPIVADADTGHGGLGTVMKLAKLFAESGVAAIHLEDQLHGGKKCGHLAGKVIVPFQDHINRLIATRLQWDIMGVSNILIARTDSESGKLLSSNIDPRDHEFLLGVADVKAKNIKSQSQLLYELELNGATANEINAAEEKWTKSHPLVTFTQAVKNQVGETQQFNDFSTAIHGKSLTEARQIAQKHFSKEIDWSPEVSRTKEGHYQYAAGIDAAISRVLAFAPYADMLWLETKLPDLKQAKTFASRIREKYPNKWLVYNLSPSFNWAGHGFTDSDLKEFCNELAKAGFVLQLISLAGLHSTAAITCELSKGFMENGMLAYVDLIQKREKAVGTDVLTHQKWSGANYIDGILQSMIPLVDLVDDSGGGRKFGYEFSWKGLY